MGNYEDLEDLPSSIRDRMPADAQRLYLAAFRRKREKMKMSGEILNEETLSERAHEAGLFAVEQQFRQDEEGRWRQAPIGGEMNPQKLDFSEANEK